MAKLIEQWLPPMDKLGNLNLIDEQGNPSNTWVIPLQKRQVASIGIQGPEGLMFSINGAPTNKTNYLTIGAYGVYNLTRHDIQDLTIRSITIYFTETNSKWLTKILGQLLLMLFIAKKNINSSKLLHLVQIIQIQLMIPVNKRERRLLNE